MSVALPRSEARVSSMPLVLDSSPVPLSEVVAALARCELRGDGSVAVADAAFSSEEAGPAALFFCVPGSHTDGHRFAGDAVERGASAIVVQRWLDGIDVPQVLVPSVREAMGPMSAVVFGRPSAAMQMVGVTGTNGKTTTTYLLESIFRANGWVPGVIGTTGARIAGDPLPLARTTPEASDLQRLLATMLDRGVQAVTMEVSSHALDQHRVDGVRYGAAVFTNLSQDHLDYHPDMEAYFAAKSRLFTPELAERAAIATEDGWGIRLAAACEIPFITFGEGPHADLRATDVVADASGVSLRVGHLLIRSPLRGRFNMMNCLAALAAARTLGIPDAVSVQGIESLAGVPGRVEPVDAGQRYLVMVDYAHTPDSIDNVLRAARPLTSGRLIVVFGCGGDRDAGKRPLMGRAATSLADLSVLTSDNPRSEDPMAVIAEIEPGAREGGGAWVVEADRRLAIRLAVREAQPGDVVVIAGKGHESYQELADRTIDFDDRIVAAEEIRAAREAP